MSQPASQTVASDQRSATDKRARTRAMVLASAIECVRETGVQTATASRIADRCGLSWGVIQYHFGDRAGLFMALLEEGFARLEEHLDGLIVEESGAADRVTALLDGTWSLLAADDYRVMLEVQLSLGGDAQHGPEVTKRARTLRRRLRDLWRRALPECAPAAVDTAQRLAVSSMRGLALERAVERSRHAYTAERRAIAAAARTLLGLETPTTKK